MIDGILVIIMVALAAGGVTWLSPDILRYLAARMWARAHAIEVARAAYREMVTRVEHG